VVNDSKVNLVVLDYSMEYANLANSIQFVFIVVTTRDT